jgi:hypothetical protein
MHHGHILIISEPGYRIGIVLKGTHGMIEVCTEFMHVLLPRPVCSPLPPA